MVQTMIIYLITNVANGKQYVGQTRSTISRRMAQHRHRAATGCHYALHSAIRKYGCGYFRIDVLAKAETLDELNALERKFIERIRTVSPNGYNLTTGGENYVRSAETRRKISNAMKGTQRCKGRVVSAEQRAKTSLSLMGHPVSANVMDHLARLNANRVRKYATPAEARAAKNEQQREHRKQVKQYATV
jgi:group I intron endonuclease